MWTSTGPSTDIRDPFCRVRAMYKDFNDHMARVFQPSHMCVVGESTVKWGNLCQPGVAYMPRKPARIGAEYKTIACSQTGILFRLDLVEGHRKPAHVQLEYESHGEVPGVLLRLTKPLQRSGRIVVGDAWFASVTGARLLRENGIYASFVVRKRKTWPEGVPGTLGVVGGGAVAREREHMHTQGTDTHTDTNVDTNVDTNEDTDADTDTHTQTHTQTQTHRHTHRHTQAQAQMQTHSHSRHFQRADWKSQ